jgi:cell division protein ZapA (FtsZ GTPase activity inhibitor)
MNRRTSFRKIKQMDDFKNNPWDREKSNDRNYCEVEIFGDIYKLVSNESDFDKLKEISSEVDRQMKMIANKYPDFPKYKIAILVALNVTDTLFRKEEEKDSSSGRYRLSSPSEQEIVMRIEKLINDIDNVI